MDLDAFRKRYGGRGASLLIRRAAASLSESDQRPGVMPLVGSLEALALDLQEALEGLDPGPGED